MEAYVVMTSYFWVHKTQNEFATKSFQASDWPSCMLKMRFHKILKWHK